MAVKTRARSGSGLQMAASNSDKLPNHLAGEGACERHGSIRVSVASCDCFPIDTID